MASATSADPFGARDTFDSGNGEVGIYRLSKLEEAGLTSVDRLPYSMRVLLEAVLRNCDGYVVTEKDVKNLAGYEAASPANVEIPLNRPASCSRILPECPLSSTWPPCGAPCNGWAAIRRRSIR